MEAGLICEFFDLTEVSVCQLNTSAIRQNVGIIHHAPVAGWKQVLPIGAFRRAVQHSEIHVPAHELKDRRVQSSSFVLPLPIRHQLIRDVGD